jgi:hypothetical protein
MPHHPPANRDDELNLFDRMIAGQTLERILLLEAEGGLGKTTLLNEFVRRCPVHIPCAPIDLKGSSISLHDIFYRLCDTLGWEHFSLFSAYVEHIGQVIIEKNVILGWNNIIEVALRTSDYRNQVTRRAQLTRAFFTDLRALNRRLLMVFDTFNEALPEVQEWIRNPFLTFAHNTPELVVIIAGRWVPERSIEWSTCCRHYKLGSLENVDAWADYAHRQGLRVPREWIEGYCAAVQGHPAQVDMLLASAARRQTDYERGILPR